MFWGGSGCCLWDEAVASKDWYPSGYIAVFVLEAKVEQRLVRQGAGGKRQEAGSTNNIPFEPRKVVAEAVGREFA